MSIVYRHYSTLWFTYVSLYLKYVIHNYVTDDPAYTPHTEGW